MTEKKNDGKRNSPMQWSVVESVAGMRNIVIDANENEVCACMQFPLVRAGGDEANAALIVEAVNAHERLVAALQRCERWFAGVTSLFDREHVGAVMEVPAMSAFYELDKIRAALGEDEAEREHQFRDATKLVGNAAALRDALESISARAAIGGEFDPQAYLDEIHEIAEAALAAPPRNCDVGTVDEQKARMADWCHRTHCGDCPSCTEWCALSWANAPYDAAQGGGDK